MPRRTRLLLLVVLGLLWPFASGCVWLDFETVKEYGPPVKPRDELTDDTLADKAAPAFDPALVDRRPLDGWLVNSSAAVFKLDVPPVKPDEDAGLQVLWPSYAAAVTAAKATHPNETILPSVNLIDGKAKQFDDGLYAALDLAYYDGLRDQLRGHVDLLRGLFDRLTQLEKDSPAAPFLAAGLELAGVRVAVKDVAAKERWLRDFEADEIRSKPAGFYTWCDDLKRCFRFLRFFQYEFSADDLDVPYALAHTLGADKDFAADYVRAVAFYRKLSNPSVCLTLVDLPGQMASFTATCEERKVLHKTVAVFPSSGSRESALFEKLFPTGLPPTADLMGELVRRIRSGQVDLRPGPNAGWYDHQVYALETLLLPGKGEEKDKLLLTRAYKKRMLEAFEAILTKHRETHLRQMSMGMTFGAAQDFRSMPEKISPRLRVEPCPSYYVRTARAYAFLTTFLEASVGKEGLQSLQEMRQSGPLKSRSNLYAELIRQRDLFYGLYLVSCEDIGLKPALTKDEPVDAGRCYQLACDWLPQAFEDPDVAEDTRVSVPVCADGERKVTRLWATLGVRMARLKAEYASAPSLKPKDGGEWEKVENYRLGESEYLIPVDEFAEVELPGLRVLTCEELRAVCDREKTKAAILAALRKGR